MKEQKWEAVWISRYDSDCPVIIKPNHTIENCVDEGYWVHINLRGLKRKDETEHSNSSME